MKYRVLTAACLGLAAAPLAAQGEFRNETSLASFSAENIQPALEAAGASEVTVRSDSSGNPFVSATFSNDRIVVATPRACTGGTDCRGLSLRAFWRQSDTMTDAQTRAAIDEYNLNAVSMGQFVNGDTIVISQYLIGDYGMPQGNIRVATNVLLNNLDELRAATR